MADTEGDRHLLVGRHADTDAWEGPMITTARKIFAGIAVTLVVGSTLTGAAAATSSAHGHAGTVAQATKEWRVGPSTKEW